MKKSPFLLNPESSVLNPDPSVLNPESSGLRKDASVLRTDAIVLRTGVNGLRRDEPRLRTDTSGVEPQPSGARTESHGFGHLSVVFEPGLLGCHPFSPRFRLHFVLARRFPDAPSVFPRGMIFVPRAVKYFHSLTMP